VHPFRDVHLGERPWANSAWGAWDDDRERLEGHLDRRRGLRGHLADAVQSQERRLGDLDRKLDGRAECRQDRLPGARLRARAAESAAVAEPCKRDEGRSAA
jgi:hypothetical protein